MYENYMGSNILGLEAVSLVERSNIQCPVLGVSFIRGSTVIVNKIGPQCSPALVQVQSQLTP